MIVTPGNRRVINEFLASAGDDLVKTLDEFGKGLGMDDDRRNTLILDAGFVVGALMQLAKASESDPVRDSL